MALSAVTAITRSLRLAINPFERKPGTYWLRHARLLIYRTGHTDDRLDNLQLVECNMSAYALVEANGTASAHILNKTQGSGAIDASVNISISDYANAQVMYFKTGNSDVTARTGSHSAAHLLPLTVHGAELAIGP